MIICKLCGKKFKRIDTGHLLRTHEITLTEYREMFPGSPTVSDSTRELISRKQSEYAKNNPEIMSIRGKKAYKNTNDEIRKARIKAMTKTRIENKDKIYTKERNKKISNKQRESWESNYLERCSANKNNWKKMRDRIGAEKYYSNLRKYGIKGYEALVKNKHATKPEVDYEENLQKLGINYLKEYNLDNKFFDFYIPDEKLLIEIDGVFWHPLTLEECKYEVQKRNFKNDIIKNNIAEKYELKLLRIRV